MSFRSTIVALGALATSVAAHGTVKSFTIDGKENQGFLLDYYYAKQNGQPTPKIAAWSAENLDNGFVGPESYGNSDINCHKKAEPGAITAKVAAGGKVTFNWGEWPHGIGPVLTYVAECGGDCSKADKTALKWVKIDAAGHDGKTWAAQKLIDDGGKWTTTVPASLKAGNYVFRHEIIALHAGGDKNGAQNYPQCINIEVTGSGSDLPAGTLGTDLYKADDKGILFNPYGPTIDYTVPGPALFAAGSGSGSGSGNSAPAPAPAPAPTSAAPAAPSATAAPAAGDDNEDDDECDAEDVDAAADEDDEDDDECDAPDAETPAPTTLVTSARPAATPAPAAGGAGAKLYGQCGGITFNGPTSCAEGTCKFQNPWYSQCLN